MSTSLERLVVLALSNNCLCLLPLLVVERIYGGFLQLLSLRNQPGLINFDIIADILRYRRYRLNLIPKALLILPLIPAHRGRVIVVVLPWVFRNALGAPIIAMIVLESVPQFYRV